MSSGAGEFEVEAQGDHEFLVRLHGRAEVVESWFRLTPSVVAELGAGQGDEEHVVRRTVEFLLRYQDVEDFPSVVELEDVLASYSGYAAAVRS